jgi:hypothetical protein
MICPGLTIRAVSSPVLEFQEYPGYEHTIAIPDEDAFLQDTQHT